MVVETRKLSELKPAKYNPRKALTPEDEEYRKIKRSIEQFDYVDPIIINKDGTIISGHQRRTVLMDLGYIEVDVVIVNLSKNDEKALNVALNKIDGQWDNAKLKDLLVELDLEDYDFTLSGFSQNELDDLIDLSDFEAEVSEDNFDADSAYKESTETEPLVRPGEVWQLGRHRLMCGDATSRADVQKLLAGEELDLLITDPPYNVGYEEKAAALNEYRPNNNGAMKIENDVIDSERFYEFLVAAFTNACENMRDGAAAYIFHADMQGLTFRTAFRDSGLKLAEVLIWEKNNFVIGKNDYHWRHEPILYGWKEGAAHYFVKDRTQDTVILEDDIDLDSMKKAELVQYIKDMIHHNADKTTVIFEKKPMSNSMHPTMKPLELIAKFIKNSSKSDWNIGDFFGGSGSTLMAAEQLGRNAYLMEIDEHYATVIIKRWEDFTGQKANRIEV